MRRYTILSIVKTNAAGAPLHRYDAQRGNVHNQLTGNYICPTLNNDTKTVTDFICMPNTYINSVCDESRHLNFEIGEVTTQGRITGFVPKNSHMEVLIAPARTVSVPIESITKIVVPTTTTIPVQANRPTAVRATTTATASRSQQPADEIAALQTRIEATRDIRLEKTLKKSIPKTLQEFLIDFFTTYNSEKNTIYVDDKTIQTTVGRRRSLGDIYKICKYYFPSCTLKEVLVLLYRVIPTIINDGFRTSYCSTIHKRVWYYSMGLSNTIANGEITDEYGHIVTWYTSKF